MKSLSNPYDIAIYFLKFRPRSEQEVINKLKRKKIAHSQITKVIERLKKERLIDDQEFARLWVQYRLALKPSGKYLLRRELQAKGVAEDLISAALEVEFVFDEKDVILELVKQKYQVSDLREFKNKQKVMHWLLRRGFGSSKIIEALEQFQNQNQE